MQVADNGGNVYTWDRAERVATRPLAWYFADSVACYAHDGNKNVSEVIATDGSLAAHYGYASFGSVIAQRGTSAAVNPWRFSSEFADDELGCVYYNYREYEYVSGRWASRDLLVEPKGYCFVANAAMRLFDVLGAYGNPISGPNGPLGPADPYDLGGYLNPTELKSDCDRLEYELSLMCPSAGSCVKTAWQSCCCGLSCRSQAKQIANSVYEVVAAMQRNVIAGGWLGNFVSWIGYGYGCVEWQKAVADAINDSCCAESACFKGIGVGEFYPFLEITRHNWVKIFGPNTKNLLFQNIKESEGVEVDPWPSGGRNIFPGSFPNIDGPTYWRE